MIEKTILVLLSAALATSMFVFLLVWRQLQQVKRYCRQLNTAIQKQERDIAQQRYSLAILRQKIDNEVTGEVTLAEEELMDSVLDQMDEKQKEADRDIPKDIGELKQTEVLQFLKKAIKNNQISVSLQSIVKLPQRAVVFYEVYARIKVGEQGYIPASQFIAVARDNNLMSVLDNVLLLRCLQLIKRSPTKDGTAAFFVNISVSTLNNKTYVNDLINFLSANPKLSSRLIFEIRQADSMRVGAEAKKVMEGLALLGCRFSMDHITLLGLDVDRLVDQNISFVKLNVDMISKEMQEVEKRGRLKKLKTMLETSGITVIMEKIENERQLLPLVDLYVDYAQGYLFGKPEDVA
jgi:EAL domain-containing protein (putative c-di-GMP-specific phosphodiesterase class I)